MWDVGYIFGAWVIMLLVNGSGLMTARSFSLRHFFNAYPTQSKPVVFSNLNVEVKSAIDGLWRRKYFAYNWSAEQ